MKGEVTAFGEPGERTPNQKGVYATVQSDFYVLIVFYQFYPDEAFKADCEPSDAEDCLMTAAELAEFVADDYLDAAYESIETKLGRM
ncbi:hypothetical protein [Glycomyces salinus]|uniref:hypothetical protein n=1 Tax=Glycomyces salinus TaxID=980294 RepID=UPI001E52B0ED|nr:hypothetical protein [Glycomyces salinus]